MLLRESVTLSISLTVLLMKRPTTHTSPTAAPAVSVIVNVEPEVEREPVPRSVVVAVTRYVCVIAMRFVGSSTYAIPADARTTAVPMSAYQSAVPPVLVG